MCTVVSTTGRTLLSVLTFTFAFHFPLALLAAVSCVAEDDGLEKACPFAWVNSWLGRVGATTQGDGRSWDLSFVKATRWITQPVGWWGGDWGAAGQAGEDA